MRVNQNKIKKLITELMEAEDDSLKSTPNTPLGVRKKVPVHKPVFPMDFILFKFPKLKVVLDELLTVTFRDYITNIYVIAPKPTTFKVVLKNKQDFLLIYDNESYSVKIAGKKYYLMNLGEKERAIQSIANLLNTKKFVTSKMNTDEVEGSPEKKSSGGGGGGGNFPGGEGGGDDLPDLPPDLIGGSTGETPDEGGGSDEDENLPLTGPGPKPSKNLAENIKIRVHFEKF